MRRSTKLMTATAITFLLVPSLAPRVLAADLVTGEGYVEPPQPDYIPSPAAGVWDGPYAGIYAGYDWSKAGVMSSPDPKPDGMDFGAYLGVNKSLTDNIIGGLELQGGKVHEKAKAGGISVERDCEASLRARMGYAVEQNLIYGLAGVGTTQVKASSPTGSDTEWLAGWNVGAGVEHQFTDNVVGRIEYDYSKYGDEKFGLGATSPEIDLRSQSVKVGVGVKF